MYLRILIPPILVQMSTHTGSSSQPRPSSAQTAPNSPRMPSSHDFEDQADPQADAAVWKRKYLALKNTVDTQTSSKRKSG